MPKQYKPDLSDLPDVDPRPLTFDEKWQWLEQQHSRPATPHSSINGRSVAGPPLEQGAQTQRRKSSD